MVGHPADGVGVGVVGQGQGVEGHQPGHAQRVPRQVAGQALFVARQLGLSRRLLVERVEADALHRVERRDLQHVGVLHPAHRDGVVEVDRARALRRDPAGLEAGLGEHRHLRLDGHVEGVEQGLQVAAGWVERQLDVARPQGLVQRRDRVVPLPVGVADGGMVARLPEHPAALPARRARGQHREKPRRRAPAARRRPPSARRPPSCRVHHDCLTILPSPMARGTLRAACPNDLRDCRSSCSVCCWPCA